MFLSFVCSFRLGFLATFSNIGKGKEDYIIDKSKTNRKGKKMLSKLKLTLRKSMFFEQCRS